MEAPANPEIKTVPEGDLSAIYLHIPFCRRECYYCNFTKLRYERDIAEKYANYLIRELKLRKNRSSLIRTVYFGGGSPAVVPDIYLEEIVITLQENFNLDNSLEMTVELNPEECNPEKLRFLNQLGFNRISVGVQSFSDADLRYLGRNHDSGRAREGLNAVVKSGFESVSADLIIGLPNQKRDIVDENIMTLSGLGVDHISAYILEGVKDFGEREVPDPDHQGYLYNYFREKAGAAGFEQYEVSNYCRSGKVSAHNMNYWEGGGYIGAGLSASGFEGGEDYTNHSDLKKYFRSIEGGILPVETRVKYEMLSRSLVTGLRLIKGIGIEKTAVPRQRIHELVKEGFLEEAENYIRVVPSKMVVLNEILSYLL